MCCEVAAISNDDLCYHRFNGRVSEKTSSFSKNRPGSIWRLNVVFADFVRLSYFLKIVIKDKKNSANANLTAR
jgi:hypothetical protein